MSAEAYWQEPSPEAHARNPSVDDRLPIAFYTEAVYDKLTTEGGEITAKQAREWIREHSDDPRAVKLQLALDAPTRRLVDNVELEPAGRVFHRDQEFIKIGIPGKIQNVIVHKVKDSHRKRFAQQYAAFKEGRKQETLGTPLATLTATVPPILRASQIRDYQSANVNTVEQLVAMPDVVAQHFMGHNDIKRKSENYLEATKGVSATDKLNIENEKLRTELAAREALMRDMNERLERMEKASSVKEAPRQNFKKE